LSFSGTSRTLPLGRESVHSKLVSGRTQNLWDRWRRDLLLLDSLAHNQLVIKDHCCLTVTEYIVYRKIWWLPDEPKL
jgi:hypothetical protein